jgi:hypothetical protein
MGYFVGELYQMFYGGGREFVLRCELGSIYEEASRNRIIWFDRF